MLQQSSLDAFEEVMPKLIGRRLEVYNAIKRLGEASDLDISKYLNLPINSITPRRNELQKLRLIECAGMKLSESNVHVAVWRAKLQN